MTNLLTKFTRYFMTGGAAAIVDAGGFGLLNFLGISVLLAATISFSIAAVVNYLLSSQFVFAKKLSHQDFYKFLIFALIGLIINVAITSTLIYQLNLYPMLAKTTAIGMTFVINFFLNARFVFK